MSEFRRVPSADKEDNGVGGMLDDDIDTDRFRDAGATSGQNGGSRLRHESGHGGKDAARNGLDVIRDVGAMLGYNGVPAEVAVVILGQLAMYI